MTDHSCLFNQSQAFAPLTEALRAPEASDYEEGITCMRLADEFIRALPSVEVIEQLANRQSGMKSQTALQEI